MLPLMQVIQIIVDTQVAGLCPLAGAGKIALHQRQPRLNLDQAPKVRQRQTICLDKLFGFRDRIQRSHLIALRLRKQRLRQLAQHQEARRLPALA